MQDFTRIVVDLLIFAAILVAAYCTARYLSRRGVKSARSRHMQVEDRLTLARDKTIYLIKVGDEHYLIGTTGQQMTTLGKPELGDIPDGVKEGTAFSSILDKVTGRGDAGQKQKTDADSAPAGGLARAKRAWNELLRRKRENEEALRKYRMEHKKREDEDE